MKRTLVLLVLMAAVLAAWHPQDDYSERYVRWKRDYAKAQIKELKEGVLIVRLHTRTKSIDLYRQNGNAALANKMEDDQYQENKEIMAAFAQNFDYAPVYFFFSDDTERIKAGDTKGVFLNSKMLPDTSINPALSFYMVAEYGPLEGETRVIPGDTLVPLPDYVPGEILERALVVKDKNFLQMRDPFPYYIRAANRGGADKQVAKLNAQMHSYLKNATK